MFCLFIIDFTIFAVLVVDAEPAPLAALVGTTFEGFVSETDVETRSGRRANHVGAARE